MSKFNNALEIFIKSNTYNRYTYPHIMCKYVDIVFNMLHF